MPRYCAIVLVILLNIKAAAECKCAWSQLVSANAPITVFTFSDGRQISVCGFKDIHASESKAIYSEYIMSECGNKNAIDSGYATENIVIYLENDTLFLESQELLAVGEDFRLEEATWLIERIFYGEGGLHRAKIVSPALRYSPEQINTTLKRYNKTRHKNQLLLNDKAAKRTMQLANQLMIAAISGSEVAKTYFFQLQRQFQPSGDYAEWYDDMAGILQFATGE